MLKCLIETLQVCLIYASSKSSWLWLLRCSAQRAAAASLACFRLELMIFVNIQRSSNASASQGRREPNFKLVNQAKIMIYTKFLVNTNSFYKNFTNTNFQKVPIPHLTCTMKQKFLH